MASQRQHAASINTSGTTHDSTKRWLGRYHRKAYHNDDKSSNTAYHVFAKVDTPMLDDDKDTGKDDVDFDVVVGPISLQYRGWVDYSNYSCDIDLYVKVPLLISVKVATITGDLESGIDVQIGISGVVDGTIRLYIKDNWVWMDFDVDVLEENYSASLKLFPWQVKEGYVGKKSIGPN